MAGVSEVAAGQLAPLDSDTFDERVYDEGGPCAVLFTRRTCAVCHRVRPVVERVAAAGAEGPDGEPWAFFAVDAEESFDLTQRFGLAGVPQLLLFVDGELAGQRAGALSEDEVRAALGAASA